MASRAKASTTTKTPTARRNTVASATRKAPPKPVVRKKTTSAKKTSVKKPVGRRRKSTAEPKRIIKRKAPASKKTTASDRPSREDRVKEKLALQNEQMTRVKEFTDAGMKLEKAAAKVGVSLPLARRLLNKSTVKPGEKVVGTDREVGKAIAKLRKEGVPWPTIRARTGMSGAKIRSLYEQTTGESASQGRTAKPKPTAKATRSKKTGTAKRKAKATARAPRTRKAKAAASEDTGSSGMPKGRRAQRTFNAKLLSEVVWNLDTKVADLKAAIAGKMIEVSRSIEGRPLHPTEHAVVTVVKVQDHDREGRVISFIDENRQTRYVSTREITGLK